MGTFIYICYHSLLFTDIKKLFYEKLNWEVVCAKSYRFFMIMPFIIYVFSDTFFVFIIIILFRVISV
jgi:hypothetical protein